jgi:hypothetical protein
MRFRLAFLALTGAISIGSAAGAVDYSMPGPEAVTTSDFANGTAGSLGGKLVVPNAPGKYPLLVVSHGFSGNADQQVGWGQHFGSYGFVAVVPSLPGGLPPNHMGNGDVIRALAQFFSDPANASPAQGKVDGSRVGLSGHSAGGLQTTFAAAQLKPRATVLFDPVDFQGTGKPVYGTLCSPVMGIFAEPGGCNTQAEWSTFKTTAQGPLVLLDVVGSNHCDPINPAMPICDIGCGGVSTPQNRANYSRYATAFLLANLKDDAAAAATITASALSADTALRGTSVKDAPNCAIGTTDGGVVDAGRDASTPSDGSAMDVTVDRAIDVASPDATAPPRDAAAETSVQPDATADAPVPPVADATVDTALPPMSEPPATDAGSNGGSGGAGGSTATGGTGGAGAKTMGNAESSSGCNCAIVSGAGSAPRGFFAALVGCAAMLRRRSRRSGGRASRAPSTDKAKRERS